MGRKKPERKLLPLRPCVGIMVLNREDRVWAGHRLSPENGELSLSDHRWQMPQGGIDRGEDALAAARRELWEETGMVSVSFLARTPEPICYELPEELLGIALKGKYRGQIMDWFAFRFEGDDSEVNIANPPDGAPVEFDSWRWVEMEMLPGIVVPFKRQVYQEVVSAFRHLVSSADNMRLGN